MNVVAIIPARMGSTRLPAKIMQDIGVNVHYIPVHLHPCYQERVATGPRLCQVAEAAYERLITPPIFSRMTSAEVEYVINTLRRVLQLYLIPRTDLCALQS